MQSQIFLKKAFSSLKKSQDYIDLELKYGCNNYHPVPCVIKKGLGVHVWDVEDRKYIDFLSAYSAVNQGHCHPKIIQALVDQAQKVTLTSRAFHNESLGPLQKYMNQVFGYDKVLFMNSGVEAGESAIKIARKWAYEVKGVPSNQAEVLFAKGNFWGRTLAACASTDDESRYHNFGPFQMGFSLIAYDHIDELESKFKSNPYIAAYMLEPIQGEKGVILPKDGYLRKVRELCTKYNVLMICDEVQTGLGRTGKLLASDHENVRPDIVTIGKALSGGVYPVSAVMCDDYIMNCIKPGQHGSTYGGNSLACAVAKTAIEVLLEENMIENSAILGNLLAKNLRSIDSPIIKEIRGRGLFAAVQFNSEIKNKTAFQFCKILLSNGVLAKQTHENTVRFSPPLVITEQQVNQTSEIIQKSIKQFELI